jgi:hypothetical protein
MENEKWRMENEKWSASILLAAGRLGSRRSGFIHSWCAAAHGVS